MSSDTRDPQTYQIIGAAMEVHRVLGCGFREPVYHTPLAIELRERHIPFRREVELPIFYKGQLLPTCYRADFICFEDVLVEVKALHAIGAWEESQVINYLCAAGIKRGLVINFGARSLQWKRVVWTPGLQLPVRGVLEHGTEQNARERIASKPEESA